MVLFCLARSNKSYHKATAKTHFFRNQKIAEDTKRKKHEMTKLIFTKMKKRYEMTHKSFTGGV